VADSAYIAALAAEATTVTAVPRHSLLVRITHWTFTVSFFGLVVSGVAILLAHPRFYWGETGGPGAPSLFDLPLPWMLTGQSGWGRALHFQSAWLSILAGLPYVVSGLLTQHFRNEMAPARSDLSWRSLRSSLREHLRFKRKTADESYNVLQRISYLCVVFVLFPLTILTGFAMSPSITSVFPWMVTMFGGMQSARTIHFFLANLLVLFLIVHVAMVIVAGFGGRMKAMIVGSATKRKESQ
jgi:thiosulfate reductase cytochrome b subunit